jgi:hypothetical protein
VRKNIYKNEEEAKKAKKAIGAHDEGSCMSIIKQHKGRASSKKGKSILLFLYSVYKGTENTYYLCPKKIK